MKYCPKCGSSNADDYRFCLSCGAALDGSDDWVNTVPVNQAEHNSMPSNLQQEQNYGSYNGASDPYPNMPSGSPYTGNGTYPGGNPDPASYGSPSYGETSPYGFSPYQQAGQKYSKPGNKPGRKQKKNQPANPYSTGIYGSQPPKKKKGRAGLIAAIVAALIIAGGAGGYFLYTRNKNGEDSRIADAATEDGYQILIDDQSDLDVTIGLYQEAIDHGQYDAAYQVEQHAMDAMSEDDFSQFIQTVDEIDQENQLIAIGSEKRQYEIIAELGALDSIPFTIADEIWMIEKDGKYSYINPEGKTVSESDGVLARIYLRETTLDGPVSSACIADDNVYETQGQNSFPNPPELGGAPRCGVMHGDAAPFGYIVRDDETVSKEATWAMMPDVVYEDEEPEQLLFVSSDFFDSFAPYIFNPKTDKLYGPYTGDNPGAVNQLMNDPSYKRSFDERTVLNLTNFGVVGPFWTQHDNHFVLHSEDDEQHVSGLDEVKLIDYTAAGGIKDSHLTVYDKNLAPIYSGSFESGAAPIGSVIPVEINGTWYLINSDPDDEDESTPAIDSAIQMAAGTYIVSPDLGQKETQFTIREDGSFSCLMVTDHPYGYVTDNYSQYEAAGVLTPKTAADGSLQFTISNLKITDSAEYRGKIKDGRDLVGWPIEDLFDGRTIFFYPAKTAWDEIDSVTQKQLLRMEVPVTEGEPLKSNVIRINGTEITLMQ